MAEKVILEAVRNQAFSCSWHSRHICVLADHLGPYDAIHVGAAAPTLPQDLIDQLGSPGRMFIPVGTSMQYIEQVDKDENGNVSTTRIMGVMVGVIAIHFTNVCELIA